MSSDPSLVIQAAVVAALKASPALVAIFGGPPRVYDVVPVNNVGKVTASFPYLTVGEDQIVGDSNQCSDSSVAHVKVEVWSREPGFGEAKQIAAGVRGALDVFLDLSAGGHRAVTHNFDSALPRREPDGLTRRVICMFRYHTTPLG